jgi:endonuclease/exonuclease/phosphatase family metal-dependent hydrolase
MRWRRARFTLILLAAAGCGKPGATATDRAKPPVIDGPSGPKPATPESSEFRVLTFNTGLAVGIVPDAEARAPETIRAVADAHVDLACVQEVWLDQHWQKLVAATREKWPNAIRPPAPASEGDRCSADDLKTAMSCVKKSCKPGGGLTLCAISSCGSLVTKLSSECIGCLTRDPTRPLETIEAECASPSTGAKQRSADAKKSKKGEPARIFGGSSGLGLLTRAEVIERDYLPLEAAGVSRGVLYAKVKAPEPTHELAVFCTHLTADLSVPYPGRAGSWKAEQRQEVEALIEWTAQRAGRSTPMMVLGDLNTGPGGPTSVRARLPENYARFVGEGFVNPYLAKDNPTCTFCYDNPLTANGGGGGLVIDHVLVKNLSVSVNAARIFDQPIEVAVDHREKKSRYSDHYGVLAVLGRPGS